MYGSGYSSIGLVHQLRVGVGLHDYERLVSNTIHTRGGYGTGRGVIGWGVGDMATRATILDVLFSDPKCFEPMTDDTPWLSNGPTSDALPLESHSWFYKYMGLLIGSRAVRYQRYFLHISEIFSIFLFC